MAQINKNLGVSLGAEVFALKEADPGVVSRFRVHVTAVAGTVTSQARISGSAVSRITALNVYPIGSTTAASTITATGIYDIDAAGLDCALSSGTSCTFDFIPLVG